MKLVKLLNLTLLFTGISCVSFGQTPSTLNGVRIPNRYAFGQSESAIEIEIPNSTYNAIRGVRGSQLLGTIHFFDLTWGSSLPANSAGAINLDGENAVTIGPWNDPTKISYFRKSDGNVGIGTSMPSEKLDVEGKIKWGTNPDPTWGEGVLSMASGWGSGSYATIGSTGGSANASLIMLHNPHVPWRTDNAASPSYAGRSGLRMAADANVTTWWDMGLAGDFFHIFRGSSGNPQEFLRITSTGEVGVGTSSPQAKLHVTGASNESGLYVENNDSWIGFSDGKNYFRNTTIFAELNVDEKVGIGTNQPDSKLTVKGIIHAEEVKVDLSVPGPDYVFESDYPLASLEDTKAYIEQNKHLPGIPSSDDMQQNGVNLLEMNMKLLEKVEELTLHLIEQSEMHTNLESRLLQKIEALEIKLNNLK
jgi:hypothetical protein